MGWALAKGYGLGLNQNELACEGGGSFKNAQGLLKVTQECQNFKSYFRPETAAPNGPTQRAALPRTMLKRFVLKNGGDCRRGLW